MAKSHDSQTVETRRYVALCQQLMAERGLDQKGVAELLGIHSDYVSKLLRADRKSIGAEVVRKACDAIDLDPHYFFDDYVGTRPHTQYPYREYLREEQASSRRIADLERRLKALEKESPTAPNKHGVVRRIRG